MTTKGIRPILVRGSVGEARGNRARRSALVADSTGARSASVARRPNAGRRHQGGVPTYEADAAARGRPDAFRDEGTSCGTASRARSRDRMREIRRNEGDVPADL